MTSIFRNTLYQLLLVVSMSVILGASSHVAASPKTEAKKYEIYDFDELLDTFRPSRKGGVDIPFFRKIQFDAEILELPQPRRSKYLQQLFRSFGGEKSPKVTMGIIAKSASGAEWNLYIADELVPAARELLVLGDKVTFYTYHAYTSDFGPGLVVHAFDRHARPNAWIKAKGWLAGIFSNE